MSAIAAFLVLSTPGAFAQEAPTVTMTPPVAAPTPQTPPTVPEPSTTAPVATPQTAQPAPVIRVPLDIPAEKTAPAPKAAERATAPAPARAERAAPRARPAAPFAAAATPAAAPAAEAPLIEEATPIAAPMAAPAEPIAEPTPLPAETASTTGDAFPWEIAGGAAALLIIGGAGLAFARRRRVVDAETTAYEYEPALAAAPEPVARETQPWITPAYAPPEEVAPRTVPAFVAAPSGSIGRHEAMAMAGPTDDNPFATLSKRLKRARFLDQQERTAYDETLGAQKDMARKPVSAWEIAQRPAPAMQEQEVRRPEPARVRTSTSFRPGYSKS
ncbi:hypothetical protein ASE06_18315 [Sphingopyxis sp. Root214]|uniref:hypothetical protein n=1 Tax=unclassified Sphingopyxis TaxID=2614943 RepID=UPI0006F8D2E3|nr:MULTISPECIES: hypothetical protein [unclassified Sphingopyxis]KQZ71384.1 hypothetical protein ASD73_15980 [Sphingopyxis sp. Root154]KRC05292.1 hypothetical protein ASE06_18315 [Sphingopyxis sp. Root214]